MGSRTDSHSLPKSELNLLFTFEPQTSVHSLFPFKKKSKKIMPLCSPDWLEICFNFFLCVQFRLYTDPSGQKDLQNFTLAFRAQGLLEVGWEPGAGAGGLLGT